MASAIREPHRQNSRPCLKEDGICPEDIEASRGIPHARSSCKRGQKLMKRKEIGFCGLRKTPEKHEKREDSWQQMTRDKRPFLDLKGGDTRFGPRKGAQRVLPKESTPKTHAP